MKDVDTLISEINAAFAKGQTREGTLLADQAVKQYPLEAAVWILRGQLNQHNGHLLAARQDLEKAYGLQHDNPLIVKRLFIILEQLNDYTAVRKLLDEAIERLPHDDDLFLTAAELDTILGDFQAAKAMTLRVLKDSPDHAGAIYNLAILGEGELAGGLDKVEALMEKTSSSSA